ncbi:hypothetical protein H4219_000270 [Mycoemilia scoparia]|uniref:ATP-grasp domain-containing protein n=1 Tax=Mycoemilia scoparia TaxID=417184 RepID=A0A9W8DX39_9FUNG|nr:hypothetical protein H4219_000270 [Mycoemilia scoparia]
MFIDTDPLVKGGLKVLVIGNGGREHALAWALAKSQRVAKVYVSPGNGGTAIADGKIENVSIGYGQNDFQKLVDFAKENEIDLAVPGPEQPLVDGISDILKKNGVACFGPSKMAARVEGSKAFSKDFMKRHNIPTARYQNFVDYDKAKQHLISIDYDVVIKASGLAAGKGVLIPKSKDEALAALESVMVNKEFGEAGQEVVIEELLVGQEISILSISDGYSIVSFPPAQDHKRAYDNDQGPNTGGMGAYAPAPIATPEILKVIESTILKPSIDGMRKEGFPFVGCLFTGFMLTSDGPKVLEYNCRFGDPETEVVLPLISDDCQFIDVLMAASQGHLDSVNLTFKDGYAATVVMASEGYPGSYPKGRPISFATTPDGVTVFQAGTKVEGDGVVTSGGRVLTVTGVSNSLQGAIDTAYKGIETIQFQGGFYRKDIGAKAIAYLAENAKPRGITYADAGVNIEAGNRLVDIIKPIVKATKRPGADSDIGGFGGIFDIKRLGYKDPLFVSATDGVGTKLMIAHELKKHDSVGIDLVAMQVNDIVVQGAEPLFFLDYYACGHLDVQAASEFIKGVADGCLQAGCALVGGETAEMPGLYTSGDYDVAGFAVGVVERDHLLPLTDSVSGGDLLIGLPSSGVHSNGFSLVRKVVTNSGLTIASPCPWNSDISLGEALLTPTRIYVKQLLPLIKNKLVKAMAHITGGGFIDNIPRVLPDNVSAEINLSSWDLPPVFKWVKSAGNIETEEMARTFNCGIGMVLIVNEKDASAAIDLLKSAGETSYIIGNITEKKGDRQVVLNDASSW